MSRKERPYLVDDPGELRGWERGDEAHRSHARDDGCEIRLVDEREACALEPREEHRPVERGLPGTARHTWCVASIRLHDRAQLFDPVDGLVLHVPDQPEPSTRPQNPMDLGQGR